MQWYIDVIKKYVEFSGRARRKEFWMFQLINTLILLLLVLIVNLLGEAFNAIISLYAIFVFIPSLALTIRRLHDIGRSGWWFLIGLIPLAWIVLVAFMFLDSEEESNKFGPNPKLSQV